MENWYCNGSALEDMLRSSTSSPWLTVTTLESLSSERITGNDSPFRQRGIAGAVVFQMHKNSALFIMSHLSIYSRGRRNIIERV